MYVIHRPRDEHPRAGTDELQILSPFSNQTGAWSDGDECVLRGISVGGGDRLANLGSILLCGIAIAVSMWLLFLSQRKKAAVGRR